MMDYYLAMSIILWVSAFFAAYISNNDNGKRRRSFYKGSKSYLFFTLLVISFLFYVGAVFAGLGALIVITEAAQLLDSESFPFIFEGFYQLQPYLVAALIFLLPLFASRWGTIKVMERFIKTGAKTISELRGSEQA